MHKTIARIGMPVALIGLLFWASSTLAHHGWAWAEDKQTEMTGVITEIYIGPPHPRLMIDTDDGPWQVDLGNPRQTRDAGFVDGVAEEGDEIIIIGHRSKDSDEKIIKAVRATIDGEHYTFYPDLLEE
ncbi:MULTISPECIES: hypothetical protein [Natronospira]|uniref:DUF5666 domain-containing protein n=1 Tax=Natronospira bacteriovora TaxID=3069753 RepID=A0ABU0WA48_9GAMM|nr:hypothetical protein [Natronospira sp. AB-CW4]MDQ2070315.1 hypothetical protein [Natronospira sp. AB-CW4]